MNGYRKRTDSMKALRLLVAAALALAVTGCGGGGARPAASITPAVAPPPAVVPPPEETPPVVAPPPEETPRRVATPPRVVPLTADTSPPEETPTRVSTTPAFTPKAVDLVKAAMEAAAMSVETSSPDDLPSSEGSTSNMNTWGSPGSPDVEVRTRRGPSRWKWYGWNCWGWSPDGPVWGPCGFGVTILDKWTSYPADADDDEMKVHVRAKETPTKDKSLLVQLNGSWGFAAGGENDFFATEAHLEAPGTPVQPAAQGTETSATWTGRVIAVDSAPRKILIRGFEIGGKAELTFNFAGSTLDVNLTELRTPRAVDINTGQAGPYPSQSWKGLSVSNGSFSDSTGNRTISGTFRHQDATNTDTNADTVGGVFNVHGTMKGGFVATFSGTD